MDFDTSVAFEGIYDMFFNISFWVYFLAKYLADIIKSVTFALQRGYALLIIDDIVVA